MKKVFVVFLLVLFITTTNAEPPHDLSQIRSVCAAGQIEVIPLPVHGVIENSMDASETLAVKYLGQQISNPSQGTYCMVDKEMPSAESACSIESYEGELKLLVNKTHCSFIQTGGPLNIYTGSGARETTLEDLWQGALLFLLLFGIYFFLNPLNWLFALAMIIILFLHWRASPENKKRYNKWSYIIFWIWLAVTVITFLRAIFHF